MYDKDYLASDANTTPEENTKKTEQAPEGDERGIQWEANHQRIVEAISDHMCKYRALPPSITQLAKRTGMSRTTIYAHMKEFSRHPVYLERRKMFDLMNFDIMMKLCSNALDGNMTAIKLYLQMSGAFEQKKQESIAK